MVQSDELKLIESKISIFNKRKEFLERSITRKFKSDTAPSEANLSILSINKLKTEVQFTCTYNENGEIIYEGEIREG
jgi:hypothetical protein